MRRTVCGVGFSNSSEWRAGPFNPVTPTGTASRHQRPRRARARRRAAGRAAAAAARRGLREPVAIRRDLDAELGRSGQRRSRTNASVSQASASSSSHRERTTSADVGPDPQRRVRGREMITRLARQVSAASYSPRCVDRIDAAHAWIASRDAVIVIRALDASLRTPRVRLRRALRFRSAVHVRMHGPSAHVALPGKLGRTTKKPRAVTPSRVRADGASNAPWPNARVGSSAHTPTVRRRRRTRAQKVRKHPHDQCVRRHRKKCRVRRRRPTAFAARRADVSRPELAGRQRAASRRKFAALRSYDEDIESVN